MACAGALLLLLAACGDPADPNAARGSTGPGGPVGPTPAGQADDGRGTGAGDRTAPADPGGVVGGGPEPPSPFGPGPPPAGTFLDLATFPYDRIVSGGVPKDGIPALTNPPLAGPGGTPFLSDADLVLGVVIGGQARAYPHNIGWWHEIVNDQVAGIPIAVTYCPLTGTGLVFAAEDEAGGPFELGVSGLLFNNNLVMYDRRDGRTLYPQLLFTAVRGQRQGERLHLLPVTETRWDTWKVLHPDTEVVAGGTYDAQRYRQYPYGDYRTNHEYLLFALSPSLTVNPHPAALRLGAKERVLGVRLNGAPKAYPYALLGASAVLNDEVGGTPIVVAWDRAHDLAVPFLRTLDGRLLTFEAAADPRGLLGLRDRETVTLWGLDGRGLEGELAGAKLQQVPAHTAMWFAWVTFWQNTDVWE
ncbi:MAG: DUF3179 domain-containing protein [Candidatus Latescibacterota bacterium]